MLNRWNFLKTGFYEGIKHPMIRDAFDIKSGPEDIDWAALQLRYNIAPTDQVLTVMADDGERRPAIEMGLDTVLGARHEGREIGGGL